MRVSNKLIEFDKADLQEIFIDDPILFEFINQFESWLIEYYTSGYDYFKKFYFEYFRITVKLKFEKCIIEFKYNEQTKDIELKGITMMLPETRKAFEASGSFAKMATMCKVLYKAIESL